METPPTPSSAVSGVFTTYQVALRMAMHHSTSLWLITLSYLPLGLFLAGWAAYPEATGSTVPLLDTLVSIAVSGAALGVTVLWAALTSRTLKHHRYWLLVARELEPQILPGADYLRRAMNLDNGEAVQIGNERVRLEQMERPKSVGHFQVYYGMFLLIFVFLLMINLVRFGRVI